MLYGCASSMRRVAALDPVPASIRDRLRAMAEELDVYAGTLAKLRGRHVS